MLAFIILAFVDLYIYMKTGKKEGYTTNKYVAMRKEKYENEKWTVYGTMGCGWTRKQLKYMDDHDISYTFINCENGKCEGVSAMPTLVSPTGTRSEGYKEMR